MTEESSKDKREAVSVYLDPETVSRITAIAFHQDRSVSSVIRRQMEDYTADTLDEEVKDGD
jgi:predicted transcriptional regulator